MLAKYILGRIRNLDELTNWTVALINRRAAPLSLPVGDLGPIGLTERTEDERVVRRPEDTFVIRRLVNPPDEGLDLSQGDINRAAALSLKRFRENPGRRKNPPTGAEGPELRAVRSATRGLLLIYPLNPVIAGMPRADIPAYGIAVSFPKSSDETGEEYVATRVYLRQLELDL
jgi:hypothetical protein